MKKKVGIVGKGYFGKTIFEKLSPNYDVVFFTGRELKISYEIDWVVVASSTSSHNTLSRKFIENGVNVFIEKPMCESFEESKELFELAEKNNVLAYVDDVFLYHPTFKEIREQSAKSLKFCWEKYGSFTDNIYNNLTYHDIYMAIELGFVLDGKVEFSENRVNRKKFSIGSVDFYYNRLSDKKEKIVYINDKMVDFKTQFDPLCEMFSQVFSGSVDFNKNRQRSLATSKVIDRLKNYKPKAAVVGGGIFGITSALKLDQHLDVTLFEKNKHFMQAASSINQYRLHRGYHYPRSIETAVSAKKGTQSFLEVFDCELKGTSQYYAISERDSKVNPIEYENFLNGVGLAYEIADLKMLSKKNVARCYRVEEGLFDPKVLYDICVGKIEDSSVKPMLELEFGADDAKHFDYVINATYANINCILPKNEQMPFQFELCEKLVLELPSQYKNIGIVVMDGPFMCIDPYGDTPYHVMGNVVHAIHHTNIGFQPEIPEKYRELLDCGVIDNPPITNFDKFMESASHFFEDMDKVIHVGSMFTIRTVLPKRDHDDARPSIIKRHNEKSYSLFSGKISTAVDSSTDLLNYVLKN